MDLVITTVLFVFVVLIGAWSGISVYRQYTNKPKPKGKLVIVKDLVDDDTYTALVIDPLTMSGLKTGEEIILEVELRQ